MLTAKEHVGLSPRGKASACLGCVDLNCLCFRVWHVRYQDLRLLSLWMISNGKAPEGLSLLSPLAWGHEVSGPGSGPARHTAEHVM